MAKKILRIVWVSVSGAGGVGGIIAAGFFYNHGSSLAVGVAGLLAFLSINSLAYGWHLISKEG